ncbi:unnamed protein product [Withania somnifera]
MRIAGSKEHSFAAYPFYKRTVQLQCASSGVIKKNHTLLTVSLSLNHQATLGFFPPDINELAAPHRELHRKGHPISLLWALSLVSDLSELALPSGQRGGSSDLEIGHPGYPDLLSVHFVSSMNQNLELEASLGKKPIDSVFSKSTSGLEIIDPFCEPRDSDKNPISYPPSAVLIEFQRSRSLSKRILFIRQRRVSWLPIPRLNESFHLATAKVEFGTGQRGKQGGIPLWKGKGQFQTKDPGASFPVSKCQVPRACVRRKLPFFFLVFPCNEPKGERQGSVSRLNLKSLVSPTARVKGESQDYVQPGVTCQRSPSRRKGE